MYLRHGADADVIEQAAQRGFDTSHTSLEFNVCGAGLYFAPDPRLSHHFCKDVRGRPHARCRLILARVALGYCRVSKSPGPPFGPSKFLI